MARTVLAVLLVGLTLPSPAGPAEVSETAVTPQTPKPEDFPSIAASARQVVDAISACASDMTCPTLAEFEANTAAFRWLWGWCRAERAAKKLGGSAGNVCTAVFAYEDEKDETKKKPHLKQVSVLELVEAGRAIYVPQCSGFGLTVPLYAVRYTDKGAVAAGPIKAGLGGGYYKALWCEPSFSAGYEVFGFSQGLDPSGLFQVGVAAGPQIVAFKNFQFGLAVAYDLFRQDKDIPTNGLLSGKYLLKESISWLATFSVTSQSESSQK